MTEPLTSLARLPGRAGLSLLPALAAASSLLLADPARGEEAAAGDQIETIVVTATKRSRNELQVPVSLDVVTASDLQRSEFAGIEALTTGIPNVTVAQFGDGQFRLIYRGIGATGASDNQNFNVAVDGMVVPYGNAYRLLDLERVEILRGPQGTLYGRNTNAGVIDIVPNDGSVAAPGSIEIYDGSANTRGFRLAAGGPIDDTGFFFRVAAQGGQTDGFIDNRVLRLDDTDSSKNGTLRATAGWEGGPWLVKASFTYDRYFGQADDLTPLATPRSSIAPDIGTSSGKLVMPMLEVTYKADTVTYSSLTQYADADRLLNFSAVVSPLLFGQFDRQQSFSQEFRASGDTTVLDRHVNWIGGAFLLNENDAFASLLDLTHPRVRQLTNQDQYENTRSGALFGEAVVDWTTNWQTTLGLRVADEEQQYDYRLTANGAFLESDRYYPTVQPKFVLSYFFDKDEQLYGSVTRGFRAGAVFVNNALLDPTDPGYKQEGTWQYELGLKGLSSGGTLKYDVDGFYIDWSNLQVQRSILSVSPPGVFSLVDNATSARSWGFEGELDWQAAAPLELYARGGYTNARYTDFHPSPTLNYSGNRIEQVPDYSIGIGGVYTSPIGIELSADLTRYGSMAFDSANSSVQSPYNVLTASLAYQWDRVRLALVGHNLLDENYADRGIVSNGLTFVHEAPPLNVLGTITVTF